MDGFSFNSLHGLPAIPGGGPEFQNFPDFSQFGVDGGDVHMTGGVQFDIPPIPLSPDPENFHIVGGVPFEMPPLPEFSPDELEIMTKATETSAASDRAMTADAKEKDSACSDSSSNQHSVNGQFSGSNLVQSSAFFPDFEANYFSSTVQNTNVDNMTNENSGGDDFGEFSNSSKPVNEGGNGFGGFEASSADAEFGEFGVFSSNSGVISAPKDEGVGLLLPPPNVAEPNTGLGTASAESISEPVATNSSKMVFSNSAASSGGNDFGVFSEVPLTTTGTGSGGFGDFAAVAVTDATPSSNSEFAATVGDNFGTFATGSVKTGEGEEFRDFSSSFVTLTSAATTAAEVGSLGGFSSSSARTEGADDFGGFSSGLVATTTSGTVSTGEDDFKGFSSNTTSSGNDFGEFSTGRDDFKEKTSGDDFGEFGVFSGAPGRETTSSEQGFSDFASAPPDSSRVTTKAPFLLSTNKV